MKNLNTNQTLLNHLSSIKKTIRDTVFVDIHFEFKGAKNKNFSFPAAFLGLDINMDREEFILNIIPRKVTEISEMKGFSLKSIKRCTVGSFRRLSETEIDSLISKIESIKPQYVV